MTNTKDEVLEAWGFLFSFTQDEEYQKYLQVIMEYQTDLITMLTQISEAAKGLSDTTKDTWGE